MIHVKDTNASKAFYEATLAPLGYKLILTTACGDTPVYAFGARFPNFWLAPGSKDKSTSQQTHVAFSAKTRAEVDAWYEAGIKAGGKDNGKPGLRSYHKFYYGAYLYDPDGYNLECVTHLPPFVAYAITYSPLVCASVGMRLSGLRD